MPNYPKDLEDATNKIKQLMLDHINDEIDKINTAKGDELLAHFQKDEIKLFFRTIPNDKQFIYIDLSGVPAKTNYDMAAEIPVFTVFCAFIDDTTDTVFCKSLRLMKAVKQVILNHGKDLSFSGVEVKNLLPFLIEDEKMVDVTGLIVSGIQFTIDYV